MLTGASWLHTSDLSSAALQDSSKLHTIYSRAQKQKESHAHVAEVLLPAAVHSMHKILKASCLLQLSHILSCTPDFQFSQDTHPSKQADLRSAFDCMLQDAFGASSAAKTTPYMGRMECMRPFML